MPTRPFSLAATIRLDGTGAGVAQLGPSITNEQWAPGRVSVSCSATVTAGSCEASIYCGAYIGQDTFKEGTFSGDTGDSTDAVSGENLYPGQFVFAQWAGGVPGAFATMRVQGTRTVP